MRILAVETSCDDSAAALLVDGSVAADTVATQTVHEKYGGVVPEIASRLHMDTLPRTVDLVLDSAGFSLCDMDAFAATAGPGLTGSLLVGLSWTKAAAWASGKPFLAINHLAAHLFIHCTEKREVAFPAVALLVSGGHTALFRMNSWFDCVVLGATRDDAAGEALDKTAKLMGLGYPGGSAIDEISRSGNSSSIDLPSPLSDPSVPEFSFSGLKTAARIMWEKGIPACDLAASFQKVVVDILISKLLYQAWAVKARSILIAGGVSANSELRKRLTDACSGYDLFMPEKQYATDNAVMVARAAAAVLEGNPDAASDLSCNAFARWTGNRLDVLAGHF